MIKRIQAVLQWLFLSVEGLFNTAFGDRVNPFYHLGAITFFLFWLVGGSGLYLYVFFDTGIPDAYDSVYALSTKQWWLGGILRSVHRYASDAMVLTMALHMLRYVAARQGLLASNVVEAGGFADTAGVGQPDIQFHVIPTLIGFVDREPEPGHGLSIGPCFLRPRSRGTVKLRSANPADSALFNANALSDPADVETLARGVQLAIRILEAPALARLVKRRVLPRPGVESDPAALRDYIRQTAKTVFHPSGTARMGRAEDRTAVVGPDLKVHGVDGLRVCDASVMPTLVSGNTNAPVMMIAARAASFITGKAIAG